MDWKSMRRARSRRYFSLLEILIVFALLSLVIGVGAFNIRGLFSKQRTLDDMERFVHQLRNAQELMSLSGVDGEVRVEKADGTITSEWVPSTAISELTSKLILSKKETYPSIEEISINGQSRFTLGFYSKGLFMSEGLIKLSGSDIERSVILKGYPSPLRLVEGAKEPLTSFEQQDEMRNHTDFVLQETK